MGLCLTPRPLVVHPPFYRPLRIRRSASNTTACGNGRYDARTCSRNFYLPVTQRIENARCAREGFKGFKAARPVLSLPALIEISLSRFYYPGMDAVARTRGAARRIGAASPLRINHRRRRRLFAPCVRRGNKRQPGVSRVTSSSRGHVRRAVF